MAISVRFPDQHVVRCSFGGRDTLETLSDALRSSGQLFRADDVILRGRSLIGGPDSRLRTLSDCGVRDGDELSVRTELPREVQVWIASINKLFTVTVDRGENCWRAIRPKLDPSVPPASSVLLQWGLFYRREGKWRTAVYGTSGDESCDWDEEDGQKVYAEAGSHFVREFLTPDQGLRAAPRGTPCLDVYDEVLGIQNGQVCVLDASALFEPQFVANILALRCSKKLYLQIRGVSFFEVSSGTIESFRDVLSFARDKGMTFSVSALLLREGDVIPHWSLPRDKTISIFRREGAELEIKDRRLVRRSPAAFQPNVSRWTTPKYADDFQKKFSDTVRRLQ